MWSSLFFVIQIPKISLGFYKRYVFGQMYSFWVWFNKWILTFQILKRCILTLLHFHNPKLPIYNPNFVSTDNFRENKVHNAISIACPIKSLLMVCNLLMMWLCSSKVLYVAKYVIILHLKNNSIQLAFHV